MRSTPSRKLVYTFALVTAAVLAAPPVHAGALADARARMHTQDEYVSASIAHANLDRFLLDGIFERPALDELLDRDMDGMPLWSHVAAFDLVRVTAGPRPASLETVVLRGTVVGPLADGYLLNLPGDRRVFVRLHGATIANQGADVLVSAYYEGDRPLTDYDGRAMTLPSLLHRATLRTFPTPHHPYPGRT